eukprot:745657-Hanusia_phi.AAC.1
MSAMSPGSTGKASPSAGPDSVRAGSVLVIVGGQNFNTKPQHTLRSRSESHAHTHTNCKLGKAWEATGAKHRTTHRGVGIRRRRVRRALGSPTLSLQGGGLSLDTSLGQTKRRRSSESSVTLREDHRRPGSVRRETRRPAAARDRTA